MEIKNLRIVISVTTGIEIYDTDTGKSAFLTRTTLEQIVRLNSFSKDEFFANDFILHKTMKEAIKKDLNLDHN